MITRMYNRLRRFRFDWKLTLLTALLMPLTLALGVWQLQRGDEKEALQKMYDARAYAAAVPLAALDPQQDLQYRQVQLQGRFDNAHDFLLDNRSYQGQIGYELIEPFVMAGDKMVLVNRGWLAQGPSRQQLPTLMPVEGEVSLVGSVYQNVGTQLVLGPELETAGWPKVVETLDVKRMAELAGILDTGKVFPHTVRLAEAMPGVLVRYWPVLSMSPERHRGYAVQWFLMATALVALYLYHSTKATNPTDEQ